MQRAREASWGRTMRGHADPLKECCCHPSSSGSPPEGFQVGMEGEMKEWCFEKLLLAPVWRMGWIGRAGVSACGWRLSQTVSSLRLD